VVRVKITPAGGINPEKGIIPGVGEIIDSHKKFGEQYREYAPCP
jgi:hypothetical protein